MLSGRGLCDELITRSEESFGLCCVVVCDLETSRMGAPYIPLGCLETSVNNYHSTIRNILEEKIPQFLLRIGNHK